MKTIEEIRQYKKEWQRKKKGTTLQSLSISETWKGRRAELIALNILADARDMNKQVMNQPFDIFWNGKRIDVKSCNLYKRKFKRGKAVVQEQMGWWVFNKNKHDADYYFCICMIDNIPERYYLIPFDAFNGGITIGQNSEKFNKFLFEIC